MLKFLYHAGRLAGRSVDPTLIIKQTHIFRVSQKLNFAVSLGRATTETRYAAKTY